MERLPAQVSTAGLPSMPWLALAAVFLVVMTVIALTTRYYVAAFLPGLGILGLFAVFRRPDLAYLLLIFLVPFEMYEDLFAEYQIPTFSKVLGATLIVVAALKAVLGTLDVRRLRSPLWWWILGFVGVSFLSAVMSPYTGVAFDSLRKLLTAAAVFALGLLFLRRESVVRIAPYAIIASTTIPALMAVSGLATVSATERAVGTLRDPNFFCALLMVSIPLIVVAIVNARAWSARVLGAVLLVLHVWAALLTYSRTGFIVLMFVALQAALYFLTRLRPRHLGFVMLAGAAGFAVVLTLLPKDYGARIRSIAGLTASEYHHIQDTAIARRLSYFPVAMNMVRENPLLGGGPGTFPMHYAQSPYAIAMAKNRADYFRAAHNTYLDVVSGTGLAGLAMFLGVLGFGLVQLRRARREAWRAGDIEDARLARFVTISFVSLLAFLFFLTDPYHRHLWFLLAFAQILLDRVRMRREAPP